MCFLMLGVLVLALAAWCGVDVIEDPLGHSAAGFASQDANMSRTMANTTKANGNLTMSPAHSVSKGDVGAADASAVPLKFPRQACALSPVQLSQVQSIMPQLSLLVVSLVLVHIWSRTDRTLTTEGSRRLCCCRWKVHQVLVPAKRRPWKSDYARVGKFRWSVLSNSYNTVANGAAGEHRPLLPRPTDLAVDSKPSMFYEAF